VTEIELKRRDFLRTLGLGAGATALAGCEGEDPYHLERPDVAGSGGLPRGHERFVATACAQCAAGCGVSVRVVEGRAVKIEGNDACPVNRGGIGPRGLSGLQVLYDPDRITGPMRRVGPRGTRDHDPEAWEPVPWDEAIEELGGRLLDLREAGTPEKVVVASGLERGMTLELWRRFARAYGTPNVIDGFSKGNGPVAIANFLMQGVRDVPAYDWSRARYVLSLGSEVLQSSCQMVYFARSRAHMRRGVSGTRSKIVHVGPVGSATARNADEWISIRPGTYGAFALALAHVLVRDGLHDEEFVRDHCVGFEPWDDEEGTHLGLRDVLAEYAPERVAEICDVPAHQFERIAADLAEARPSFVLAGSEQYSSSNGVSAAMAVQALNAILGAIDRPGGVLTQREAPLDEWPEVELDEVAEAALARPILGAALGGLRSFGGLALDFLPDAILNAPEASVDTLLLHYSNPLFARAEPERWRRALSRVPCIVSFSPFWDETTVEVADWVLPDHTYLERWEDAATAPSTGHPVFGIRQPVVDPVHDTMHTADVVLRLADVLDEPVREAVPWKDFKTAVKSRLIGIYRSKRGTIVEDKGSAFLRRMYADGYWSDPEYPYEDWDEVLRTPSGRFEFHASVLRADLASMAAERGTSVDELLASVGVAESLDRVCLPHHEPERRVGDPAARPVLLIPHRPPTYAEGSGANQPWLQELHVHVGRKTWATEAEMHPQTADELGLKDGGDVLIQGADGEIRVPLRITSEVRQGLVLVPQGGGHTAMGRFARGWGANVMHIVSLEAMDRLFGVTPVCGTRVAVRRAGA
jgi:anaerobic selenocysteine-containing dehydrogenase